ncbi:hypothetical protein [Hymenobacter properus]|uniref:Uncharacterized protein n=1 Tax=Hymenobacter properus TaxID=2791026 RepID=A0A931BIC9_9BACT|nr:hypothetical protein [Hymenobacter properus]MBF9144534.1 hypothetical protein [Hymenobacter properus]MBR7723352.1 hypothetical protein [Microvirga sp. SRT04]
MRFGILILVVLALAALAALLWWRFKGPGKPAAPVAVLATRNHHSLRTFHYETAAATQAAGQAAASAEVGEALARLLSREDLAAPEPVHSAEKAEATLSADNAESTSDPGEADLEAPAEDTPRPASIRHAAGALASLLDVQEEAVVPAASAPEPAVEADEEPAAALFHNPLTAPAPTANDQANRAAEIALRQQRRARMSADAAAQRAALSGLFPGAGSPIPAAKPS